MKKIYALFLFSLCFVPLAQSQITLSQTTSNAITPGNTVACATGQGVPADNIYYRSFNLAALGYTQFDVNQVSFGINNASTIAAGFAVDVIIYSNTGGTFPAGTLTPVATVSVPITAADANTVKTVPITASVVAPAQLVFGVSIPDEATPAHTTRFSLGSNSAGQSAEGYISSVACGIGISTITSIGFPNVHIVMSVTGIALSVDEFSVSKVSISPNPTSDYVNIELHPSNSINRVEIYSVTGQLVQKATNQSRIDISSLNAGVYLMKVITANGTASKKLIKT
ncbi:MAG: T9SS type A sorting domain-containing protein [Gelidibacter sp.]